jgi:hypothetical protein
MRRVVAALGEKDSVFAVTVSAEERGEREIPAVQGAAVEARDEAPFRALLRAPDPEAVPAG